MASAFWLGLAAASLATVARADASVEGVWRTPVHHGVVQIVRCGASVWGQVAASDVLAADPDRKDSRNKNPALRERPLKGLVMLFGLTGGPKAWTGGTVYNPEDGNSYKASLMLVDANTVKLTGCLVAPFCRSQTWTRAN